MATMMPSDIGEFETEGEKTFYKFLEGVAKPDAHYLCWYLPEVNGKEPDFLLYSDEVGLIIFKMKDWILNQIEEANPHHFLIQIKGKTESRKEGRTKGSSISCGLARSRSLVGEKPTQVAISHGYTSSFAILKNNFYQSVLMYGTFCRALSFVTIGELRYLAVETIILS